MIAPSSKLLTRVAVVLLPFSLLPAIAPASLTLSIAAIVLFASLALLDVFFGLGRLSGIQIRLAETTRMTRDKEGILEVHIQNQGKKTLQLRIGIPLPQAFESDQEDMWVRLPDNEEFSRVEWPCRPLERGHFLLDSCHLERLSPLGFWCFREMQPVSSEIRVYPNLMSERRNLAALFLNRGLLGLHAHRQVGQGREFEKLREYLPGDNFDDIHWKATAKRGRPITKEFQIEKTQEVYVVVDASRLSARPSVPGEEDSDTILERYIASALVLGLVAERQGDLFGLLTFSERVNRFVRAKSGKSHYDSCRDALYTLRARTVNPDFDELCSFIRLRLRRRALIVFLTNLEDPVLSESFARNADLISRQHLVLVNMFHPPGAAPLFETGDVEKLDDLYRELAGHIQWQDIRQLERLLEKKGVRFHLLDNDLMCVQLVTQYINVKRRQIL